MNYITTTELRTKTSELTQALKSGQSVSLLHRSRVIGVFKPSVDKKKPLSADQLEKLKALLAEMKPKKLIPVHKRDYYYRKHLMEKYGKYISGR